jgi:FkbM family methyltransferase
VAKFEIDGITLRIPSRQLTPTLEKALATGRYESGESAAVKRHLEPGDKYLDLGAGAGYVSSVAARVVGGANVVSVEANADMIKFLENNLQANGAAGATVLHGAVVADSHGGDTVNFAQRDAFWASSIATEAAPQNIVHAVPALRLSDLLARYQPSVVVMDVEGAEVELCQQLWPDCVRLLIMEIHTGKYPPASVKAIFDGLSRSNMTYMPWGSRGEVVVFQRVPARE